MILQEFLELLQNHRHSRLQFEYGEGARLRSDYHITEVKNVHIDATDCGGRTDAWKETVIQLWESPEVEHRGPSISAGKALAILNRVYKVQPLMADSLLKFEYGNANFHTSQMEVVDTFLEGDLLILRLGSEATQCKAEELCGLDPAAVAEEKGCAPGSGCC